MADHASTRAAQATSLAAVLAVVVALALPVVLIGNALLVLVHPWLVHAEYALPGFPDDPFGLAGDARADLAVAGVQSISPWDSKGVERLREARLPGGGTAFGAREIAHMDDVRGVVQGFMLAWLIAAAALAAAALALSRAGTTALLRRAFGWGATLTLAAFGCLALFMAAGFDSFFTAFHGVFFDGDSWRFSAGDTLLRLYPDAFWTVAAGLAAGIVLAQAGAVLWASRR